VQAEVRKNIIQELRTLHQSVCQYIVPYHGQGLTLVHGRAQPEQLEDSFIT